MIINDSQWYLTKLVGEVFLRYNNPCYVNDICGTSDTSNTANSSAPSKIQDPGSTN